MREQLQALAFTTRPPGSVSQVPSHRGIGGGSLRTDAKSGVDNSGKIKDGRSSKTANRASPSQNASTQLGIHQEDSPGNPLVATELWMGGYSAPVGSGS